MVPGRLASALIIAAVTLIAVGCDDNGDAPANGNGGQTATSSSREAQRPDWFPASFPLPAETTVSSDMPDDAGGGTVQFSAPVSFESAVAILDTNLPTHGYTVGDTTRGESEVTYAVDSRTFRGSVAVRPQDSGSMIEVTLQPQEPQEP
jgi:hypothetical protein